VTPIPLVRVSGSHAAAGWQLGEAIRPAVRRVVVARSSAERCALSGAYREATLVHLPWILEEIDAVADAAGVDPLALFSTGVEELHLEPTLAGAGCTDLVVEPQLSRDGHRLVAHNNDLAASQEEHVVAIEWQVDGEPIVFTLGIGPWISVGWNDAGLSVTGNELTPNDERVGIPRLLQMRDVLTRRTLEDAVAAVLHPARASSYNWMLASPQGTLNVEGSATAAATTAPDDGGLVHTNHYLGAEMLRFEGDPEHAVNSAIRCDRAERLLRSADALGMDELRTMLSDHEGAPDSLCRHADSPTETKTVFWCIADVSAGVITYGRGNPCESDAEEYAFR
jgi:isopenicillin-N N-acyltransferase-like protein